ncbi:UNVERIFIED_CONTAM: Endoribonuclease YBEY, chloroplastic, partial [Sesamum indicum]
TSEVVAGTLCPYWAKATEVRAYVTQAVSDMLEIVAPGTLKGSGVRILFDHLWVTPKT